MEGKDDSSERFYKLLKEDAEAYFEPQISVSSSSFFLFKNERVDEVPFFTRVVDQPEVTRTDPVPSPLPNLESVSKETDENPTLDMSSPLGKYNELQSQLEDIKGENDSPEEFHKLSKEVAEAYLEHTDFCLFEQLLPLWSAIPKRGRNVDFQPLAMVRDTQRILEIYP
ncbi:hypothetical protein P9112_001665 [Eukaryota sp. TZLM1-RC]